MMTVYIRQHFDFCPFLLLYFITYEQTVSRLQETKKLSYEINWYISINNIFPCSDLEPKFEHFNFVRLKGV